MPTTLTPCFLFGGQAEEAVDFYTSLFDDGEVLGVHRAGAGGPMPQGSVLAVTFRLQGQQFLALNGPEQRPTDAVSFQIGVETQEEVDHYWYGLSEGGEESMCGWLRDRYGMAWQVVPAALPALMSDPDPERAGRAMQAMLGMKKIDIEALRRAADGG